MTGKVKVVITKDKDVKVPTGVRLLVRRCCTAVLVLENFEGSAEVSVTFVTTKRSAASTNNTGTSTARRTCSHSRSARTEYMTSIWTPVQSCSAT